MIPTEQDKELRDKLQSIIGNISLPDKVAPTAIENQVAANEKGLENLMQFITADRERVALEARLDELNAIYGWSYEERTPLIFYPEHRSSDFAQMAVNGMGTNFTVRDRIAELKAQQANLMKFIEGSK